jgi:hypothetical protein
MAKVRDEVGKYSTERQSREFQPTTEKALNKAAHKTTTVRSVLFAANEMELFVKEKGTKDKVDEQGI